MISEDGWIMGTYLHSLFHNTELRRCILARIAERKGLSLIFEQDTFSQSDEYDKLAGLVRLNLDIDAFYRIIGLRHE